MIVYAPFYLPWTRDSLRYITGCDFNAFYITRNSSLCNLLYKKAIRVDPNGMEAINNHHIAYAFCLEREP